MEGPQFAVLSILTKVQQPVSQSEAGKDSVVLSGRVYSAMLQHYMRQTSMLQMVGADPGSGPGLVPLLHRTVDD